VSIDGYCDSDWTSCPDDRRSILGYCIFVGDNLVSWKSKKQSLVAISIKEAEHRTMVLEIAELLWLKSMLVEVTLDQGAIIKLWCDNKSIINIANNPVQ
jgi:hypothetical protein